MHELSLAMSMRELIEEQAAEEHFNQVTKVVLEVGQLSHVQAEAMQFCFESAMQGSIAEKAALEIQQTQGKAKCPSCHAEVYIEQLYDPCENCGSFGLEVISGDQVRVINLEVV